MITKCPLSLSFFLYMYLFLSVYLSVLRRLSVYLFIFLYYTFFPFSVYLISFLFFSLSLFYSFFFLFIFIFKITYKFFLDIFDSTAYRIQEKKTFSVVFLVQTRRKPLFHPLFSCHLALEQVEPSAPVKQPLKTVLLPRTGRNDV